MTMRCSFPLIKLVHWKALYINKYIQIMSMQFPSCLLQQPSPIKLVQAAYGGVGTCTDR